MIDSNRAKPATGPDPHEARLGDRGEASGRNIEQNRAVGQDDPMAGSRMGREANKKSGFPGTPDSGTDAAQVEEGKRVARDEKQG